MILVEILLLIFLLIGSLGLQCFIYKYDLSKKIKWSFIINIYKWIISNNLSDFLALINKSAAVFGGINLFIKNWIDRDSENIVYILILLFALLITNIFKLLNLHIISFFISLGIVILMIIPFCVLIKYNLQDSKRREQSRNTPKIKVKK